MKFKNKTQRVTEISTASLPDIVFLLLFFFMVSATIKPKEEIVSVQIPEAQAITNIERAELVREISIGSPKDASLGIEAKLSIGSRFIEMKEIIQWVAQERETLPEAYQDQMIVLLRADEKVQMGVISDVQEELKKAKAYKILYRTLED